MKKTSCVAVLGLVLAAWSGIPANAQTIPNVPDARRSIAYTVTSLTTNFDVPFPIYGDCSDLYVTLNAIQFLGFTCSSKSGTPFANVARPVTDAQVVIAGGISSGQLIINGQWHPRWSMGTAPGISRTEFNRDMGTIVSGMREMRDTLGGAIPPSTIFSTNYPGIPSPAYVGAGAFVQDNTSSPLAFGDPLTVYRLTSHTTGYGGTVGQAFSVLTDVNTDVRNFENAGVFTIRQNYALTTDQDMVALVAHGIRSASAVGGNSPVWGANIYAADQTGRKSSVSAANGEYIRGLEVDAVASGPDDASTRVIVEADAFPYTTSTDGATTFAYGYLLRNASGYSNTYAPTTIVNGFFADRLGLTGTGDILNGFVSNASANGFSCTGNAPNVACFHAYGPNAPGIAMLGMASNVANSVVGYMQFNGLNAAGNAEIGYGTVQGRLLNAAAGTGQIELCPTTGGTFACSGLVNATGFSGNGSQLTALNASNLASGTIPVGVTAALTGDVTKPAGSSATTLATVPITKGGTGVTTLPSGILKGAGTGAISAAVAGTDYLTPTGNGSQLTGITRSQVSGAAASGANSDITSLSGLTGNITFAGTGERITGDMSNATLSNRLMFQTSVANANTSLHLIPNGTATTTQFIADTDPALINSNVGALSQLGTETRITSTIRGTATQGPMTFYIGAAEKMRLDASGNLGVGLTPTGLTKVEATSMGLTGTTPILIFKDNGGAVDQKYWRAYVGGGIFTIDTASDAYASSASWLTVTRSGITPGTATFNSSVVANALTSNAGISMAGTLVNSGTNGGIELGSTSASNAPYIDFHSSGNAIDYDARIIASGGNATNGQGALAIYAAGGVSLSTSVATASNTEAFKLTKSTTYTGGSGVTPSLAIYTTAGAATTDFQWGVLSQVTSLSATGENVALYGQAFKQGAAPVWGGVFESRDTYATSGNPVNPMWGIEVDVMGYGSDNNAERRGIEIVYGRHNHSDPAVYHLWAGISFNPWPADLSAGKTVIDNLMAGAVASITAVNGINLTNFTFSGSAFKSPGFSVSAAGAVAVQKTVTATDQTTYALNTGTGASASDLTLGTDASNAYLQSWASKPLVLNGQGNPIKMPGLGTTGTAVATLCVTSDGTIFKKTTTGACL